MSLGVHGVVLLLVHVVSVVMGCVLCCFVCGSVVFVYVVVIGVYIFLFFMRRRPPKATPLFSSAASVVYKGQVGVGSRDWCSDGQVLHHLSGLLYTSPIQVARTGFGLPSLAGKKKNAILVFRLVL